MSYFAVYFILILDNIKEALPPIIIISILMFGVAVFLFCAGSAAIEDCCNDKNKDKYKNLVAGLVNKIFKIGLPVFFISVFLAIFCPTTKQAATIYLLPKIASNKSMQQLPSQTANLLLLEVKKEIASLKDATPQEVIKKVTK